MVSGTDLLHMMDPSGAPQNVNFDAAVSIFDARYALASQVEYGEIYVRDIDVGIALAAQDTYYQLAVWSPGVSFGSDGVNGLANGAVPDVANDHITISASGVYSVRWTISCYSGVATEYAFIVRKNNGASGFPNTEGYRTTSTASAVGSVSGGGLCNLGTNDTIEMWVERKDGEAVSKTITVKQATLVLAQVG